MASAGILQEFAQTGLKPDEDLLAQGKSFAQMVFNLLQQKSRHSLARVIIGGSVGKSTAIKQIFDFDCVIFINGQRPPFEHVLDELEDILDCCGRDDIVDVKTTPHSVHFKCPATEFEYDLLPATNFVTEAAQISGDHLIELQRERTLAAIQSSLSRNPRSNDSSSFSSSLVESQVQFMRGQSGFVHELVRLCKFWNKTVYIEDYVNGRSTIVELIAVYVGRQVEKHGSFPNPGEPPILGGFKAFLEFMLRLPRLEITFDGARPATKMVHPILLEPANPFNNLLASLDKGVMDILCTSASETLTRLSRSESQSLSLEKLFEAQPMKDGMCAFEPQLQPKIYMGYGTGPAKKSMTIHNKGLESDNYLIRRLKSIVDTYVLTDIIALTNGTQRQKQKHGSSHGHGPKTAEADFASDLQKHLSRKVSKLVLGPRFESFRSTPDHRNDVEFRIPYERDGQPLFVTVGFCFGQIS